MDSVLRGYVDGISEFFSDGVVWNSDNGLMRTVVPATARVELRVFWVEWFMAN